MAHHTPPAKAHAKALSGSAPAGSSPPPPPPSAAPPALERVVVAACLVLIAAAAVGMRVVKSVRFGPVLDEHDSYFNHRVAVKVSTDGLRAALDWFDDTVWFPYGRAVGATVLPGLPWAAATAHRLLATHPSIAVDLETVCVYFPPVAAAVATVAGFALTREILGFVPLPLLQQHGRLRGSSPTARSAFAGASANRDGAGLLCAALLAVAPGMLQRSLSGNFDNECLGAVLMLWFFREWLRALRTGGLADVDVDRNGGGGLGGTLLGWRAGPARAGVAAFLLAATWGGYAFAINVVALHVAVLLLIGDGDGGGGGGGGGESSGDGGGGGGGGGSSGGSVAEAPGLFPRVYSAFTTMFVLGAGLSLWLVPFHTYEGGAAGFLTAPEHALPVAVLLGLQVSAAVRLLGSLAGGGGHTTTGRRMAKRGRWSLWWALFAGVAVVVAARVLLGAFRGGRYAWALGFVTKFQSDPVAGSVGDVKPSAWASLFMDLHVLLLVFPAGVLATLRRPTEGGVFLLCFAGMALVAGAAVSRFVPLFLAPAAAVVGAVALGDFFHSNFSALHHSHPRGRNGGGGGGGRAKGRGTKAALAAAATEGELHACVRMWVPGASQRVLCVWAAGVCAARGVVVAFVGDNRTRLIYRRELALVLATAGGFLLAFFVFHCTWVAASISTPSVFLTATEPDGSVTVYDDYREAYAWLAANTSADARVLSWWDYGYHISAMANRTTYIDSFTSNLTHIGRVGAILCSPEHAAHAQLQELQVDYVLVVFGGAVSYRSDDINKLLWMLRVTEHALPDSGVSEDAFLTHREATTVTKRTKRDDELVGGALKVSKHAPEELFESVLYKLSYYRFGKAKTAAGKPRGWDTVRQAEIGRKHFELRHFEEVYTSPRWLVRIYKVKDADNLFATAAAEEVEEEQDVAQ